MALSGFPGGSLQVMHVKERRYVSKILTILLRDFPQVLAGGNLPYMLQLQWQLSFQNLVYLLPFYCNRVLFHTETSPELED